MTNEKRVTVCMTEEEAKQIGRTLMEAVAHAEAAGNALEELSDLLAPLLSAAHLETSEEDSDEAFAASILKAVLELASKDE